MDLAAVLRNIFYRTGRRPCMVQQNLIKNKPKISRSDKLWELSQEFRSIATAKVQYLYKTLDDDFVLLLGGNSMLRMEMADDASPTDARQKTFYSNNPQEVLVYEALFELLGVANGP
jgi:hypothetical protein